MELLRRQHPAWKISGLDNSEIACKTASEKGFSVYCGTIEEVGLPSSGFDCVYMNSVIEHLHDPRFALKKLNAAMKTGGNIRIMTPNISSLGAKIFRQYWHALDTPRHLHLFNRKTLEVLLKETGFEIRELLYKKGMSVEIKSFYHVIDRVDRRMSPIIWRLSVPIGNFLAIFGMASTMILKASKVRDI